MMHRNLDRRVEVLVRLPGEDERRGRSAGLLDLAFDADTSAWELDSDGDLDAQRRAPYTSRRRSSSGSGGGATPS